MHQNGLPKKGWLQLGTEGAFRSLMSEINVGDLPPKSPEFYEMLPSLRSSPIFLFQAKEEENHDTFHVVPSFSKPSETEIIADTYESFLRNLETSDNQNYGENLPLSPECFHITKQMTEEEDSQNLSDDLQIYLQNEISPTPVDKLYSTLPGRETTRTFEFPSFDENQRIENMNVPDSRSEVSNIECKPTICPSYDEISQNSEFMYNSSLRRPSPKRKGTHSYDAGQSTRGISPSRKESKRSERGRPSHNDIERQRRNDMKARFDSLKSAIPEIEKLERAPKIQILSRATEFINKLHEEERRLDNEKELERKRNRLLLDKLVQLTKV